MATVKCLVSFVVLLQFIQSSTMALPQQNSADRPDLALKTRQAFVPVQTDASIRETVLAQLRNPVGILSVLLIIGGDTIQKACAQLVSGSRFPYGEKDTDYVDQKYVSFTPVAFSFGWVGYALRSLQSAFGDGLLMPEADVSCLVLTVGGQWKKNENWVIGRLVRDLELQHKREVEGQTVKGGMGIYFYKSKSGAGKPVRDRIWWLFIFVFAAQFGLAIGGPLFVHGPDRRNWTVLVITGVGTVLALLSGSMPQWGAEKYSARRITGDRDERYILTRGNGHSHVFVIQVTRGSFFKNLDDMATRRPFRSTLTKIVTVVLAFFWIFLLIIVAGLREDGWFLLGVGLVGMGHNVIVANWKRLSAAHGLPLICEGPEHIDCRKVYNALFKAEFRRGEEGRGVGKALIPVFFPAGLWIEQQIEWDKELSKNRSSVKEKRHTYRIVNHSGVGPSTVAQLAK